MQFTQEVRFASAPAAPVKLSDAATLKWQAGVFLFTQNYDQDAVNNFAPFVLSPFIPFPVAQHSPRPRSTTPASASTAAAPSRSTTGWTSRSAPAFDRENARTRSRDVLRLAGDPRAPVVVDTEKSFSNVSPQAAVSYHVQPGRDGLRLGHRRLQGGRLQPGVAGRERGLRRGAHVERRGRPQERVGRRPRHRQRSRCSRSTGRICSSICPNPQVPGQFFISNVGKARSSGVEFELQRAARADASCLRHPRATPARASAPAATSSGRTCRTTKIPNTPDYTASFGDASCRTAVAPARPLYGRAEVVVLRRVQVRRRRTLAGQDAYSLANFRFGVRARTRVRRELDAERVRHEIHPGRVRSTTQVSRRRASSAKADGRGHSASPRAVER